MGGIIDNVANLVRIKYATDYRGLSALISMPLMFFNFNTHSEELQVFFLLYLKIL